MRVFSSLKDPSVPTAAVEIAATRVSGACLEWRGGQPALAAHALETLPGPGAFIGAMERLATLNLAERDPHPLEEFFLYSHPPIGRRIAFARQFPGGLT